MNLIILTENDKVDETTYIVRDERAEHISNVLKSNIGNILNVGLLNKASGIAEIKNIQRNAVILKILRFNKKEHVEFLPNLIVALPRPQTLKKILRTAATMGVDNLFLIRSEKVEKSYFHSPLLKKEKYIKYLLEGLSQGKRVQLPEVTIHKQFKRFFENNFQTDTKSIKLLAHHTESDFLNEKILYKNVKTIVAIGPEGGWNNFEIDFIMKKGFKKIKLSENILRVETAVTAVLAQIELINSRLK